MQPHPLINAFPGYFVLKDLNSVIVAANAQMSDVVGYKNINDYIGLTDYDIKSNAVTCADTFIEQDRYVINSKKTLQYMDFSIDPNGHAKAMLKTKAPYYNENGEMVGVAASAVTLEKNIHADLIRLLSGEDDVKSINTHKTYELKQSQFDVSLTPRESEVLFFLMRGQTVKGIARILDISPRTAESHVESLKHKFGCYSKSALIEAAVANNYGGMLLLQLLKN